jgi:hypothetical protein
LHLLALLFGVPRPLFGLLAFLVATSLPLRGCLVTLLLLLICHGLFLNHAVPRSFAGHMIKFGHLKPAARLLELLLKLRLYRIVLNEGLQQADCYLLVVNWVETDDGLGVTTINQSLGAEWGCTLTLGVAGKVLILLLLMNLLEKCLADEFPVHTDL